MNAVYLCVIAEPWIEVIRKLEKDYGILPTHLVIWRDERVKYETAGFSDTHFQTLEDAWRGLGFQDGTKQISLDESEFKKIASFELTALWMMDRLDPDAISFPFNARLNFFRELVGYWLDVIDKNFIELVVSPSITHRVFDYALYVACKLRKTRFVMFQMISFGSRSLLIDDIDKMPNLDKITNNRQLPSNFIERIEKVTQDYKNAIPKYELINKANENRKPSLVKILVKKSLVVHKLFTTKPNTYWVENGKSPQKSAYNWFQFYLMKFKRKSHVKKLKQKYSLKVTNRKFNDSKFVLVALHYQPEETSCPTGGIYSDQALIINLLHNCLPSDVQIVVKEHRTQFYFSNESASGRTLDFYDRVKSISNRIHFVSVDDDPFKLIDRALATVTISGTIGWESAIRGTPALVFGRAWYEQMPRVFKVKTKEDVQAAWKKVVEQKNKNLTQEILDFHKTVGANSILATHYKAYRIYDDVSMSDSVNNLVNGLADYLNLETIQK